MSLWGPYVPVAKRRANARREMERLRKAGRDIQPVALDGRTIARRFWGKSWCEHLESFSDYVNRLPRGRTYVRNGSVCHLAIQPGRIDAIVSGSTLYHIAITIKKLNPATWKAIKTRCAGHIGSLLELLQGQLSDQVMAIVADRERGLFPQPGEMAFTCDCPDWAGLCKHVAAVLYGVGHRLDSQPELLFRLRGVDAQDLITAELALAPVAATADHALAEDRLGEIFGIELDTEAKPTPAPQPPPTMLRRGSQRAATLVPRAYKTTPKVTRQATSTPKRDLGERRTAALPTIRPTGKSIARLRKQHGLSVAQFAEELGVAATSVYRWEATAGRLTLQTRILQALAAYTSAARKR